MEVFTLGTLGSDCRETERDLFTVVLRHGCFRVAESGEEDECRVGNIQSLQEFSS